MKIKIEYSDAYVRKVFVETGVVLETKYVEIDTSELTPEDRKRLLAVSSGDYNERELDFYADESEDVMKLVNDYYPGYEAAVVEKKQREERERQEREQERKAKEELEARIDAQRMEWINANGSDYLRELVRQGFGFVSQYEREYKAWYVSVLSEQTGMSWKIGHGNDYRECVIGDKYDTASKEVLDAYMKVKDIDGLSRFSYGCNGNYLAAYVECGDDDFQIHCDLKE